MKLRVVICLIALLFVSCSKDEFTYSGVYKYNDIVVSDVRMFTKNGEVNDKVKIRNYIEEKESYYNDAYAILGMKISFDFIFDNSSAINKTDWVSVEFFPDDKASIIYDDISDFGDVIDIKDGYTAIESEFIIKVLGYYYAILDKILTFFPFYSQTYATSPITGFTSVTELRNCYYFKRKENEIEFPLMTYFYHGNKSESSKAFINNKFNSKSIKYLEEGDTLVVQQFTLMLTKIK